MYQLHWVRRANRRSDRISLQSLLRKRETIPPQVSTLVLKEAADYT